MKPLHSLFFIIAVIALIGIAYVSFGDSSETGDKTKVTIYKSPTCGCCVGFGAYLQGKGFSVNSVSTNNMNSIKAQYSIPSSMDSCHTAIIEGYFVEGHIPVEAIDKLLSEKPDIDGIALPDMPSGSPGMPGPQTEDYVIYSLKDGQSSVFMVINK
jgi:hypothetical protein